MYQLHYDYDLKTFNDVKLLFTDTDSLVYEIKGENVYEQCFKDKELFDLVDIREIPFILMIVIRRNWVK